MKRRHCRGCMVLCFALSTFGAAVYGVAADEAPSGAAHAAAVAIRREALLPPNGPQGRPLPLVSHWNMGSQGRGWTPDYQVQLLNEGRHILPWMAWPQLDPGKDEKSADRFDAYYGRLIRVCRELQLPISFRGTQWEAMLTGKAYRSLPEDQCPTVITPEGKAIGKLSPFGGIECWKDPAGQYVATPGMRKLQELYPDPPLVLFVSNNEARTLRWAKGEGLAESGRYLKLYGEARSDEFKRKVVSDGWVQRYPVMFKAMREALENPTWRKNVRFVGYGAFGPSHLGRWPEWREYSLTTEQGIGPGPLMWDGCSPSYYTHNWSEIRDHRVFSTQVECMNWLPMLDWAYSVNPDLWWEISLWDGTGQWTMDQGYVEELLAKSKACQYLKDGQTYTPDRFLGWAQFGLWMVRPRVVREFRASTIPLEPRRPFFEKLLFAVDRIYADPALAEFWRFGTLVPNRAHPHPYQVDIPEFLRDADRWFLLDTSEDPPRPWELETDLPVFSMALVRGDPGDRRWLVYAHSPLRDRPGVEITIPGYGILKAAVTRVGVFLLVDEKTRGVHPVHADG